MRAKYLHFADNRRPPYYGTWRKRSQMISARRPLGQDKVVYTNSTSKISYNIYV